MEDYKEHNANIIGIHRMRTTYLSPFQKKSLNHLSGQVSLKH